jgi:putative DNA primase/helicase
VFCYGPGGNGKTVLLNTVSAIRGDYATVAAMETFVASQFDQHPTDMAMLCGARLVTAAETEEGRAWAETKIKQLTGGDPISARFMRQDFFTYKPTFKLMIIGNHEPALRNVDDAARRRINIVPFIRKPAVIDKQLEDKLRVEWPGILRWMIQGCLNWQTVGRPARDGARSHRVLFRQSGPGLAMARREVRRRARQRAQDLNLGPAVQILVRLR